MASEVIKDLYELGDLSKEEYLRKREAVQKELRWLTSPEEETKNLDKLAEFLVNVAEAVQKEGLVVRTEDEKEYLVVADTIVLATGARPNRELYRELLGKAAEIYLAGDCVKPRYIFEATTEGFLAGQAI